MKVSETLAQGTVVLRNAKDDPEFMKLFVTAVAAYESEFMTYFAKDIKALNRDVMVNRLKQVKM